jgi:hypothetical protein
LLDCSGCFQSGESFSRPNPPQPTLFGQSKSSLFQDRDMSETG